MTVFHHFRRGAVAGAVAAAGVALLAVGADAALTDSPTGSDTTAVPTATDSASPVGTTGGQSQDVHAIVVNHGDDSYRYAVALKVVQVSGPVVDAQNAAVAVAADCTDCETVAISLEGVLVYGDPTVFAPENVALAYNEDCTECATLAAAYQEVVQSGDRVRITGAGRQEIAAIRQDLESMRNAGLSLTAIDERVNADAATLLDVLRNDVVAIGAPDVAPGTAAPAASADPPAAASPTSSTQTSPTPSDTTTQSPTPSTTPGSASPTPTASASAPSPSG